MLKIDSSKIQNTKKFLCSENSLRDLSGAFKELWPGKDFFLVADENTYGVCGGQVKGLLTAGGVKNAGEYVFPGRPVLHGDHRHCQTLKPFFLENENAVPLVIGSGSLNDIVKRAAFETGRPYAVVATAASVDGYAADGAALLENGTKHTMPCPAPALILADTALLATAPKEMTAAGYGDLLAKYPAGADWILADTAKIEPLEPYAWSLVHDKLDHWTAEPSGLAQGQAGPLLALFEGLSYAGFAMQYMKHSRPVSGAEHLISHILDMQDHRYKGESVSHGFQVAVGSVACLKAMHFLLEENLGPSHWKKARDSYQSCQEREEKLPELFPELSDLNFLKEVNKAKTFSKEGFAEHIALMENHWPELCARWKKYLPPVEAFTDKLAAAGCPTGPEDIGLTPEELKKTFIRAQYLRNRYTILDLLDELTYFDENGNLPAQLKF